MGNNLKGDIKNTFIHISSIFVRTFLAFLKLLRNKGSQVSILMLTARDAVEDRIAGLDFGADDYLVKPFEFGELMARIRAMLRRTNRQVSSDDIQIQDISIAEYISYFAYRHHIAKIIK